MFKVLLIELFLLFHPLHVTITSVNQAQDSDTLNVFFRMYYDDFQLDYKHYDPEFVPGRNNDSTDYSHEMLFEYFRDNVRIYVNGKLLSGKLTDVSINNYEVLLSLTYHSDNKPRNFRIRNKILTSLYSDQSNFIYLNINNYEDAIKLTADNIEQAINLK